MIQKLVYVVLLFSTTTCFSQELSATLSAKKIQIGIPLKLTYSAKSVQNAEIEFISRKKSILAQRLDENLQSKDTVEFEILSDFSDTNFIHKFAPHLIFFSYNNCRTVRNIE